MNVEPGRRHVLPAEDDPRRGTFSIEPLAEWTSPATGIRYPAQWRLTVPSAGLDLRITPLLEDQEIDLSFRYWEGAVSVAGVASAGTVSGRGYVELTGYADP